MEVIKKIEKKHLIVMQSEVRGGDVDLHYGQFIKKINLKERSSSCIRVDYR